MGSTRKVRKEYYRSMTEIHEIVFHKILNHDLSQILMQRFSSIVKLFQILKFQTLNNVFKV